MIIEELKIAISVDTTIFKQSIDQVKKDMDGLQEESNKVAGGVKGAFKKLVDGIASLKIGEKLGQAISDGVKDAINVEAATQQIKRIMGESSNQFLKWAGTQATAFNMSKSEALKYGSEFGNLVSRFTSNTSDTTKYTEKLLKSSAIVASSTGKTMEDVMKSISSGIKGDSDAIEELGINVDSSMLQSTEAFSKFANGKSWDQLDSQTQQQIRLFAILEQSTKKYGDSVSQNTKTQLAQLVAQLKNAQLSLGEAFLPILNIVLPILTKFASGLAYVMNIVARFSQALFGRPTSNKQVQSIQAQTKAMTDLGNAAEKTDNKTKGALSGASGGNLSNQDISSDGSQGSVGAETPAASMLTGTMPLNFETNAPEITASIQQMADDVKRIIGAIFQPFKESWDLYGPTVMENVSTVFNDIKTICIDIGNTLYNIWSNPSVQESIKLLNGIFSDLFTILTRIFDEIVKPAMLNFLNLIDPSKNPVAQGFVDKISLILSKVKELTDYLAGDGFKYVKDFLELFVGFKAILFVVEMGKSTAAIFADTGAWLGNTTAMGINILARVKDFIIAAAKMVKAIWESVTALIREALVMDGATIAQYALNLAMSLNPIALIIAALAGVTAAIIVCYNKFEWFRNGVKGIINPIIDAFNSLIRGLNSIKFDIPDWVPFIGGKNFSLGVPEIPKLARGGIVDSPTLAMIGEAGKEAVVPLENTSFVNTLASTIGTAVLNATQFNNSNKNSNSNGDIVLQIDGATFARIIKPYQANENQRIGNSMIVQTV